MSLHELANIVARDLPEGCEIVLSIERGAADVKWYDPDGKAHFIEAPDDLLVNQVLMALHEATEQYGECT